MSVSVSVKVRVTLGWFVSSNSLVALSVTILWIKPAIYLCQFSNAVLLDRRSTAITDLILKARGKYQKLPKAKCKHRKLSMWDICIDIYEQPQMCNEVGKSK